MKKFVKSKLNCNYLIIVHRLYLQGVRKLGGVDIIIEELIHKRENFFLLEYQLGGKYLKDTEGERLNSYSVLRQFNEDKENIIKEFNVFPRTEPFRWIGEFIYTILVVFYHVKGKIPVCIASDPLNTLFAVALRRLGKVEKIYFHSVDYSDKKFNNRFLEYIYQFLYKFALRKAVLVGLISNSMIKKCLDFGMEEKKFIFIPNSPFHEKVPRVDIDKRTFYSLVISVGAVVEKYKFDEAIEILDALKKEFPLLKLNIIGNPNINNEYYGKIKEKIDKFGLNSNVVFLGYLPKDKSLEKMAYNSIGIAMYSKESQSYMRYADPLKVREYAACGLPTITDTTTSTGYDIMQSGAGFVCKDKKEMIDAIKRLWTNKELYEKCCANAIKFSKKYDKKKILGDLFLRLDKM